ncbi:MAG: hypothetical protein IK149_06310 [Oscillospiraceae bacterium]|nr:hypothetical protein [Oscillospiraceae bacterium]
MHLIYMSDFAGLSVPKLKNLFFQKAQLSSARVAVYMDGGKKASPFFAFFQLRRLQRKSAPAAPRFSVILPEGVSEMKNMRFRIAKNPEKAGNRAFPPGKALL